MWGRAGLNNLSSDLRIYWTHSWNWPHYWSLPYNLHLFHNRHRHRPGHFPYDSRRRRHNNRMNFLDDNWLLLNHFVMCTTTLHLSPIEILFTPAHISFAFLFKSTFLGTGVPMRIVLKLHKIHFRHVIEKNVVTLVDVPLSLKRLCVSFVDRWHFFITLVWIKSLVVRRCTIERITSRTHLFLKI